MAASHLYGVSITPFDRSGVLDEEGLRRHLRRLVEAGVTPYLAGSGSGEANGLSAAERRRIFEVARQELGSDARLRYAAFEPRTLDDLLRAVDELAPFGIDAVRLTVPDLGHGHVATAREAEQFLRSALEALPVPVSLAIGAEGLRSTPSPSLVGALLSKYRNIVSLEVMATDAVLGSYLAVASGRPVLVPSVCHLVSALALGAAGAFGPLLNLLPRTHRDLLRAYKDADLAGLEAASRRIAAVQRLLRPHGTVIPIKAALAAFGLPAGEPRLPRLAQSAGDTAAIVAGLESLGVPEAEGWTDDETYRSLT